MSRQNKSRKTFKIKNRFGIEVNVTEEIARNMLGNPSVKILGEVHVETEYKEIKVPVKNAKDILVPRRVITKETVDPESMPGGGNTDVENTGHEVKRKTVVTKGGTEVKKSSVIKD